MSFYILLGITKLFEQVRTRFLILIFFKGGVLCMSNLWWCLKRYVIMPTYGFSFCSQFARIAQSHFSNVCTFAWYKCPSVGTGLLCLPFCGHLVWCHVLVPLHCFPSSALWTLGFSPENASLPIPLPSRRADQVAFCMSPLHRVISLCSSNSFVIGLLPS